MMYGSNLNKAPKRTNLFYEWECPFVMVKNKIGENHHEQYNEI
jgi:hypothetical protein